MGTAWDDERITDSLQQLRIRVREEWNLQPVAIGIKGDSSHKRGYHRSRRWILENGSTSDYSIQYAQDKQGDPNLLSAIDISLSAQLMKLVTARLLAAAKLHDPRMGKVREFFGTVDGSKVTGWDLAVDSPSTADSSHLWHVHVSFWRGTVHTSLDGVFDVMAGKGSNPGGGTMATAREIIQEKFTTPGYEFLNIESALAELYARSGGRGQINATLLEIRELRQIVEGLALGSGTDPKTLADLIRSIIREELTAQARRAAGDG